MPGRSREEPDSKRQRSIADVGDGLLEGTAAFGQGIVRGFRGLVAKPLQGAKDDGVQGEARGQPPCQRAELGARPGQELRWCDAARSHMSPEHLFPAGLGSSRPLQRGG